MHAAAREIMEHRTVVSHSFGVTNCRRPSFPYKFKHDFSRAKLTIGVGFTMSILNKICIKGGWFNSGAPLLNSQAVTEFVVLCGA